MQRVQATLIEISKTDNPELALANATIFLDAMGHVVIAWMWLRQALAASGLLARAHDNDQDFYQGKLAACRFFYHYELPKAMLQFKLVGSLDSTCYDLRAEQFVGQ